MAIGIAVGERGGASTVSQPVDPCAEALRIAQMMIVVVEAANSCAALQRAGSHRRCRRAYDPIAGRGGYGWTPRRDSLKCRAPTCRRSREQEASMTRLSQSVDRATTLLAAVDLAHRRHCPTLLELTMRRRGLDLSDLSLADQATLIADRSQELDPPADPLAQRIVDALEEVAAVRRELRHRSDRR